MANEGVVRGGGGGGVGGGVGGMGRERGEVEKG